MPTNSKYKDDRELRRRQLHSIKCSVFHVIYNIVNLYKTAKKTGRKRIDLRMIAEFCMKKPQNTLGAIQQGLIKRVQIVKIQIKENRGENKHNDKPFRQILPLLRPSYFFVSTRKTLTKGYPCTNYQLFIIFVRHTHNYFKERVFRFLPIRMND